MVTPFRVFLFFVRVGAPLETPGGDVANFIDLSASQDQRVDYFTARLYRIEVHLRREEERAARAQLDGLLEELVEFKRDIAFPGEYVIAGANVGLLSGKGSLVRGRLPALLVGAAAGWLYGQASRARQHGFIDELLTETRRYERELGIG
jgi:hypothetical protein